LSKQVIVIFRTAHGDRRLTANEADSVQDICRRYGIPTSQITTYVKDERGELALIVKPWRPMAEYARGSEVVLFPNRNIDYDGLLGGEDVVHERSGASTWIRVRERDPKGVGRFVTELLRPEKAQEIVAARVRDALLITGVRDEPIVVGVSGGGDSNALLGALVKSNIISKDNIIPVMMLGIPDWDKGVDRAASICAEHGLPLRFVAEEETARILGFVDPAKDWVTAFERTFPDDDLEVLGVYGVRKVLESIAREKGSRTIVVGTNLEDCLADALYFLSAGKVPFPKPSGSINGNNLLCPLWLTPKSLIDGCYPKFSRENYEARYPSKMPGRAYFYYLAQMLVDAYPGAAENLLHGTGQLSQRLFQELPYDEEFGTPTMSTIPLDVRVKLRQLFGLKPAG
jgi:hypothetical protein